MDNTSPTTTTTSPPTPWMTTIEAARYARCGPKAIYKAVAAGRLRAARLNGRRDLRLLAAWLDRWLEETTTITEVTLTRGR
jgi:excisionase family DNA binding protein